MPTAEPVVPEPIESQQVTPVNGQFDSRDTDETPRASVRDDGAGSGLARHLGISNSGALKVKLRKQKGTPSGLGGPKISFPELIDAEDI